MRLTPIIAALAGVALVALGAPRLFAGAVAGPFDETVRALGHGTMPGEPELRLALGSRLHAIDAIGEGRYHADLAALRFAEYTLDPQMRERLDIAIDAHRAALERAPSQPFVWSRLALAQMLRDGYGPPVGAALAMSLETGRIEPRLLMPRVELALAVWPDMTDELRAAFNDQIVLAMRWSPERLAEATRRHHRLGEVRAVLAADPVLRARFNLLYERLRTG